MVMTSSETSISKIQVKTKTVFFMNSNFNLRLQAANFKASSGLTETGRIKLSHAASVNVA